MLKILQVLFFASLALAVSAPVVAAESVKSDLGVKAKASLHAALADYAFRNMYFLGEGESPALNGKNVLIPPGVEPGQSLSPTPVQLKKLGFLARQASNTGLARITFVPIDCVHATAVPCQVFLETEVNGVRKKTNLASQD